MPLVRETVTPRRVSLEFVGGLGKKQGFPGASSGEEHTCQCRRHKEMLVRSLGQEDPPEEGMESHSSLLSWRILWTEEPGGLQSMGPQRVRRAMRSKYLG